MDTVTRFEPHVFYFDKPVADSVATAIHHLDFHNYEDDTEKMESYKDHLHQFKPYVDIPSLEAKFADRKPHLQVMLIEPEMRWLRRGLLEMAELSMDATEDGDWGLDYTRAELNVVTEFNTALGEPEPDEWERFEDLVEKTDSNYARNQ